MFYEFYVDVWNFFVFLKPNWAKSQDEIPTHLKNSKESERAKKKCVCVWNEWVWHGIWNFSQTGKEFAIVSFNHFDVKCIAVKCWQIFIWKTETEHTTRKTKRAKQKIRTDFNKFMKHCLWRRENCFFFLYFFLSLCTTWNMINTLGWVESEYWVHITRFIVTFWQPAQRNKSKHNDGPLRTNIALITCILSPH